MGFFNKMSNAIGSASKDVTQMARDAVDVSRYTSQIEEDEQKIQKLYCEIGKYYYENDYENVCEQLPELSNKIDEYRKAIDKLHEKIRDLKGIAVCQKCGAELKKNANFCNVCGAPIERVAKNPANILQCPACGASLSGKEKFCAKCGTKIEPVQTKNPELERTHNICEQCGNEIKSEDTFCKYCGAPANTANIEKKENTTLEQGE